MQRIAPIKFTHPANRVSRGVLRCKSSDGHLPFVSWRVKGAAIARHLGCYSESFFDVDVESRLVECTARCLEEAPGHIGPVCQKGFARDDPLAEQIDTVVAERHRARLNSAQGGLGIQGNGQDAVGGTLCKYCSTRSRIYQSKLNGVRIYSVSTSSVGRSWACG